MFRIRAHRSANSIFGAALSYVKGLDGKVIEYTSFEEAQAEVRRLMGNRFSQNVSYAVVEAD